MNAAGITLRPERDPDDLAFLFQVFASTRADEMAMVPWSEQEKLAFLSQQFQFQRKAYTTNYAGSAFLIVVHGGADVGRLYVYRGKSDIRIVDIALLPSARNLGIGGFLLRELQDEAARDGKTLSIHVEKPNPARRLYDRLGFVKEADREIYDFMVWRPDGCQTDGRIS